MSKVKKVESPEQSSRSERGTYNINGGKVLVFGDLHLSAIFEGQHINYLLDCYNNMELILNIAKKENPSAVIFLGDLIGFKECNIKDHQFLMRVIMFFETLNNITTGNVFSVKGNHDLGDFSDFDLLVGLGYIKNPLYVDYYGDFGHEVRFHFVNYGSEKKTLKLTDKDDCVSDIVLGHSDYYIDGVTNWYSAKSGVELCNLDNFCGVDLVVSGHIHTPSDEVLYTHLKDGSTVGLFYTGSPSRTAEQFNDCWYFVFEFKVNAKKPDESVTDYEARFMGLPLAERVFYPKENFIGEDEEASDEEVQSETLTTLVREVIDSRLTSGDIFKQLDVLPASEDVKNLAKSYLRKAIGGE